MNENSQVHPVKVGVWIIKETADGWEAPVLIKPVYAGGEHGIHSLVLSADQQWVYLVAGNHSRTSEVEDSFPAKVRDEDQLLIRNLDGNGHAANIMALGGRIARFKLDGSKWQLVTVGKGYACLHALQIRLITS